jgi:hypothetical protein
VKKLNSVDMKWSWELQKNSLVILESAPGG